jgi:hypothetical protein
MISKVPRMRQNHPRAADPRSLVRRHERRSAGRRVPPAGGVAPSIGPSGRQRQTTAPRRVCRWGSRHGVHRRDPPGGRSVAQGRSGSQAVAFSAKGGTHDGEQLGTQLGTAT